jgi:hypothetical protein
LTDERRRALTQDDDASHRAQEHDMMHSEKAELLPARETLAFFNWASVRAIQVNANVNYASWQGVNYQSNSIYVIQL